jgi:hypothetical protein
MPKSNTVRNKRKSVKGGNRKARKTVKAVKGKSGADTWREGVMRVYKEMKAKNVNTRFGDALQEASKRKKAGKL